MVNDDAVGHPTCFLYKAVVKGPRRGIWTTEVLEGNKCAEVSGPAEDDLVQRELAYYVERSSG
jgi:hypothetical protein